MLNARQSFLNRALRRAPLGVGDMAVIRHPIVEILTRIDKVAAIAYKLDEISYLDFVPLAAAVLQVAVK